MKQISNGSYDIELKVDLWTEMLAWVGGWRE